MPSRKSEKYSGKIMRLCQKSGCQGRDRLIHIIFHICLYTCTAQKTSTAVSISVGSIRIPKTKKIFWKIKLRKPDHVVKHLSDRICTQTFKKIKDANSSKTWNLYIFTQKPTQFGKYQWYQQYEFEMNFERFATAEIKPCEAHLLQTWISYNTFVHQYLETITYPCSFQSWLPFNRQITVLQHVQEKWI